MWKDLLYTEYPRTCEKKKKKKNSRKNHLYKKYKILQLILRTYVLPTYCYE